MHLLTTNALASLAPSALACAFSLLLHHLSPCHSLPAPPAEATAPRTSLTGVLGGLLGPTAAGSLTGVAGAGAGLVGADDDLVAEPAVNLSNQLNPNNIHYDRELAARWVVVALRWWCCYWLADCV